MPPDLPDSNYRMAWEALLAQSPLGPGWIHRLRREEPPQVEAQRYVEEIRTVLGSDPPCFKVPLIATGFGEIATAVGSAKAYSLR